MFKKDFDDDNKTDLRIFLPFKTICGCWYSKCCQIQCVHELSKYGKSNSQFLLEEMVRER